MRADKRFKIVNLNRLRPPTSEQRRARRVAERELAIRPVELQPPSGKCIDIWRLDLRIAVASQFRPQIVHGNEEDVEPRLCGVGCEYFVRRNAEQGGDNGSDHSKLLHDFCLFGEW